MILSNVCLEARGGGDYSGFVSEFSFLRRWLTWSLIRMGYGRLNPGSRRLTDI